MDSQEDSNSLANTIASNSTFVKHATTSILNAFKFQYLKIKRCLHSHKLRLKSYNPSQICYFLAILAILAQLLWAETFSIIFPCLFALAGLVRELLGLFHKAWSYAIGKAIILVLYATTANIAIAFAAMQINVITGVEPSPFVFTLGFTAVVLLPFWITVSSTLFFALALALGYLWLVIRLPLKLIGLNVAVHWEDKQLPLLTMFARMLLIPMVITGMFLVTAPYLTFTTFETGLPNSFKFQVFGNEGTVSLPNSDALLTKEELTIKDVAAVVKQEITQEERAALEQGVDVISQEQNQFDAENRAKAQFIRRAIADFLFNFEAYPYSACVKSEQLRSVVLDENLVLLITPDVS